ncbi:pentapeptide repeat-containing protein [Nostoc sp. MG11]|uniref:pentapeptide repeat-containing protein n=1 Tax=Nostoc sp. MG11 TaxID=2721166 RepID=UPI0018681B0B|nr:pentapeptide repeat-containing protein [Nostoc sp. MG11]
MLNSLSELSKKLIAPAKEFILTENVEKTAEFGKAFLELAKTLQEQGKSISFLMGLIKESKPLLDVLCSAEVQVISAGLPFVPFAIALIKFYREKTHTEPTLEDCVVIISQAAYLESFAQVLGNNKYVLGRWNSYADSNQALDKALKKLEKFELTDEITNSVISSFSQSSLAERFNEVLLTKLELVGLSQPEAQEFTESVARNTKIYFLKALALAGDSAQPLADLYKNGGTEEIKKYKSIQDYLKEKIEPKPQETVFKETFTYSDIYVKPNAMKVDNNGKIDKESKTFSLEDWVKSIILDTNSNAQKKVIFIQGGTGRGKSIFCRIFADLVRRDLYQRWIPILIRLRDIEEFQPSLKETLSSRLQQYYFALKNDWLIDNDTKFLFILDGFDELRIERSNNSSVKSFIRQIGSFQEDYAKRHQVIITGRAMALHGIEDLPPNLERVEIAEMNIELQAQWFDNWRRQFPTDETTKFQQFLQDNQSSCPEQVKELAKEPLLLYLLTAMHRDNELDINEFKQATGTAAKILVYEQALKWVLTEQRSDRRYPDLNKELTGQNPEALRRILAEAAVCVVQSGGESASMEMVKSRLEQDYEAKELIAKAEEKLGGEALKTALGAFYIKSNDSGGVEFFHKSFSEFLCAERLKRSIEDWTELGKRGKPFNVNDQELCGEIYDLLGYGGLTPEIIEYLMALLRASSEFKPQELLQRLNKFYLDWCQGGFIDLHEGTTLPQQKARNLEKRGGRNLGQRQVDIYTGLNVMILLLELHRYAQTQDELKDKVAFLPCGEADSDNFDPERLLRIISYSNSVDLSTFSSTIGYFLSAADLFGANLSRANLSRANLSRANLSRADLSRADLFGAHLSRANLDGAHLAGADLFGADLFGADLFGADLSRANLDGADLFGANLSRANLDGANLSHANLNGANLSRANLNGANLDEANLYDANLYDANLSRANLDGANLDVANLSRTNLLGAHLDGANLSNIIWDEDTTWDNVERLNTARNVPESLLSQLNSTAHPSPPKDTPPSV